MSSLLKVLDAIHEVDFHGFSYGFRRGPSQHDAPDAPVELLWRHRAQPA